MQTRCARSARRWPRGATSIPCTRRGLFEVGWTPGLARMAGRKSPPHNEAELAALRAGMQGCRACDLYKNATQAVPGEGNEHPTIMFVGEQPGDQEDLAGHPFVGPAGKLLDRALDEAGV